LTECLRNLRTGTIRRFPTVYENPRGWAVFPGWIAFEKPLTFWMIVTFQFLLGLFLFCWGIRDA
jgi:hypothetical protein